MEHVIERLSKEDARKGKRYSYGDYSEHTGRQRELTDASNEVFESCVQGIGNLYDNV